MKRPRAALIFMAGQRELQDREVTGRRLFPRFSRFTMPPGSPVQVQARPLGQEILNVCRDLQAGTSGKALTHDQVAARLAQEYELGLLDHTIRRLAQEGPSEARVVIVSSDQRDPAFSEGDTCTIAEVLGDFVLPHLWGSVGHGAGIEIAQVKVDPGNGAQVRREAEEAVSGTARWLGKEGVLLLQTSGGIPAVTRAFLVEALRVRYQRLSDAGAAFRLVPFQVLRGRGAVDDPELDDALRRLLVSWIRPEVDRHLEAADYRGASALLRSGAGAVVAPASLHEVRCLLELADHLLSGRYAAAKKAAEARVRGKRIELPGPIGALLDQLPEDRPGGGTAGGGKGKDRGKVAAVALLEAHAALRFLPHDLGEFLVRWSRVVEMVPSALGMGKPGKPGRGAEMGSVRRFMEAIRADDERSVRRAVARALFGWPSDQPHLQQGLIKLRDRIAHPFLGQAPTRDEFVRAYGVEREKLEAIAARCREVGASEPPRLERTADPGQAVGSLERLMTWLLMGREPEEDDRVFHRIDERVKGLLEQEAPRPA